MFRESFEAVDLANALGMLRAANRNDIRRAAQMDMNKRQPTLGSLLRSLRARNGWTLSQMSQRTSIPVSTLSKVEHDRLTLSYDKLVQFSQRLNIRISELFAEPVGAIETAVTARRS